MVDEQNFGHQIDRLKRNLAGDQHIPHDYMVSPTEGRFYAPGTMVPLLGTRFEPHSSGLLVPQGSTDPPQPLDALVVYATHEEIYGQEAPESVIVNAISQLNRNAAIRSCSRLLSGYSKLDASWRTVDLELLKLMQGSPQQRARNLIHQEGRRLLTPQATLRTMNLILEHAKKDGGHEDFDLIRLVLGVQGLLSQDRDSIEQVSLTGLHPESDASLIAEIIRNQSFNGSFLDPGALMATFQRRWNELAYELIDHPEYVDLHKLYRDQVGTTLADSTTVALALWTSAAHARRPVIRDTWLDSLGWPRARLERALSPFTGEPDQVRQLILEQNDKYGVDWSFDALRRYPVIRLEPGELTITSPDFLLERSLGWSLRFDLTNFEKATSEREKRAVNFLRHICETQAHETLRSVAPDAPGGTRVWTGESLNEAYPGAQVADAVIDYGDAWVAIEISTRQLRREVVIGGDVEVFEEDLDRGVIRKAQQLHSTIQRLMEDETALTGLAAVRRRAYIPVLVVTEGFPMSPIVGAAMRELLRTEGLLQDPRITELRILDNFELYALEGAVQEGQADMRTLLEEYAAAQLRDLPLTVWLDKERRLLPRRPERLNQLMQRLLDSVAVQLRDDTQSP